MPFLYILKDRNNHFYIGSTNDWERRIKEHSSGYSRYTSLVLPVEIVFKQEYASLKAARKAETWLKRQKDSKLIDRVILDGMLKKPFDDNS